MQIHRLVAAEFPDLRAKIGERARQTGAAGAWPRPTQDRAFERGDGVVPVAHPEPQQRMLEQGEQCHRFKPAKCGRCLLYTSRCV